MSAITIPAEYSFVGAAVVSTAILNLWQGSRVGKARKLAKVDYPQMYAEKAEAAAYPAAQIFNCTQRAHQNTLESMPTILATTAYLGLTHPRFAAGSLAAWVVGRVVYTIGYSTGNPKRRMAGSVLSGLPSLAIILGSAWVAFQSIQALL